MPFDGKTYEPEIDEDRLRNQLANVRGYMLRAFPGWVTLAKIALDLLLPPASIPAISARLRDLRKERFGSYKVEARRKPGKRGLWEYRVHPKTIKLKRKSDRRQLSIFTQYNEVGE